MEESLTKLSDKFGLKYMNLLNIFVQQIKDLNIEDEYVEKLWEIFLKPHRNQVHSPEWMTYSRKRIVALLLLVHYSYP
jgi:hypothetical protein